MARKTTRTKEEIITTIITEKTIKHKKNKYNKKRKIIVRTRIRANITKSNNEKNKNN